MTWSSLATMSCASAVMAKSGAAADPYIAASAALPRIGSGRPISCHSTSSARNAAAPARSLRLAASRASRTTVALGCSDIGPSWLLILLGAGVSGLGGLVERGVDGEPRLEGGPIRLARKRRIGVLAEIPRPLLGHEEDLESAVLLGRLGGWRALGGGALRDRVVASAAAAGGEAVWADPALGTVLGRESVDATGGHSLSKWVTSVHPRGFRWARRTSSRRRRRRWREGAGRPAGRGAARGGRGGRPGQGWGPRRARRRDCAVCQPRSGSCGRGRRLPA